MVYFSASESSDYAINFQIKRLEGEKETSRCKWNKWSVCDLVTPKLFTDSDREVKYIINSFK